MAKKKKELNFYDALEDNFSDFVIKSDDDPNEITGVISTGVTSLDVSLGIGGIPLGRFTEIYGPESSGKTTLSLNIARNALDLGYNVLYVDPEHGIDIKFAEEILGDFVHNKERFVLIQPKTMEQTLGVCELGIQSNNFKLIILDSIGSMAPKKVHEDGLEENNVALVARRMTIFLQRNAFDVRYNNIAFIGVNQIRDIIGSYIHVFETPGGHAWKHIASLRIELVRMMGKDGTIMKGDDKIGIQCKFVVKKSKVSPPFRAFYFPIMFEGGIDKVRDLVEFASTMGIIITSGPFYKFEDKVIGNGFNNTVEALRLDNELLDKIQKMCYNIVNTVKKETNEQVIES